jgi:hypothetical protein
VNAKLTVAEQLARLERPGAAPANVAGSAEDTAPAIAWAELHRPDLVAALRDADRRCDAAAATADAAGVEHALRELAAALRAIRAAHAAHLAVAP